jgi:hypothetical protein
MSSMIEVFNNMIDVFDAKVPAAPVMSSARKFKRGSTLTLRNPKFVGTGVADLDECVCLTDTRRYPQLHAFAITKVSICNGVFVGYLLHWNDVETFTLLDDRRAFSFTRDGHQGPDVLATAMKVPNA